MVNIISELFLNTIESYPKDDLILYKKKGKYVPISTGEFASLVKHFSLGLSDLDFKAGNKLIILSENRPEWVITDISNLCLGGITVPIYTSLVTEQIKYIINDSDAKIVVFSNQDLWQKIDAVRSELENISHYISFQSEAPEEVLTFDQIVKKGQRIAQNNPRLFEKMASKISSDDIASIIYTSGTTGIPKGVMLTHENFISNVKACSPLLPFTREDTGLSFLPLSHVLERMVTFSYLYKGCSIAYAERIETIAENLLEIRPHVMVSVPRVLEKFYSKVMDNVLSSSALKRRIFYWAVKVGKDWGQKKLFNQSISGMLRFKKNLAHKLVFSKIIKRTGGRIKFFISGGAPLSKDIAEFFYAIGLVVLEGYGLTETSPVIAVNTFDNMKFGTVGKPIPGVEVRVAEDGEILTKGPNVMKGYYKKEAETEEVFEGEWFHTGDIGHLDEEGFLVITDRKKDIIVTAGGKNVAPQPIENILKTNTFISNAVVIGDRRKFLSALVVPDFEKLEEYAKSNNIPFQTNIDLVKNEKVQNLIESEINRITPNLASYEKIKKIALLESEFEEEKGEITPTLKVKRNIVEKKYKDLIQDIYKE